MVASQKGRAMSRDQAVFVGRVDGEGRIRLDFPEQQRAYCRRKLAGQCIDVIVAPQGHAKTRSQECGFHSMIAPWARDEGHRIDDLKRDLLRAIFGEQEHTNPITGEVTMVLREPHTSKLNRAQYRELIERTLDIGAECGVVLIAPNEYKELKEKERKRQAREAVPA
jgi:hypothetical protein